MRTKPASSRYGGAVRIVGLDMVGPLVTFRTCRDLGVPEVWSLVISGFPPALGVAIDWLRWRTLEVVGAVVLGGILVSIGLALLGADTRIVLLEGAVITAAFGVACAFSLGRRRPLIFYFAQAFFGGAHSAEGRSLDEEYDQYQGARSYWRTVTIVWSIVYITEATVRAILAQRVSAGTALAFNRIVPWLITGLLIAWMFWWANRLRAPGAEESLDAAESSAADSQEVEGWGTEGS